MPLLPRHYPGTSWLSFFLVRRTALAKARPRTGSAGLLDAAARPKNVWLGEHRPHDLQPDRQTFDKAAGHRGRRLTREVERPCQWRPIEPLGKARSVGRVDAGSERGDGNSGRQQEIKILMKQLHLLVQRAH